VVAQRRRRSPLRAATRTWPGRIGLTLLALVAVVVLVGPYVAPYDPAATIGPPVQPPSPEAHLGTDILGRDVLSRVLWGGRGLLAYAVLATLAGYVVGGLVGLYAGFARSATGAALMRAADLMLVFPPILFLLLLVSGLGSSQIVVVVGIAILHVPSVARVIYAAALETGVRGYVEAAVARGESTPYVVLREILPNIVSTVVADAGPRITVSIFLLAGLNYLGLGVQPPSPDWALMITENRGAMQIQPWTVIAPVAMIALFTLALNLTGDAIARAFGRTVDVAELARR
jgi:ABC-type dipeptide/oligopeptide/nickel transport system permease subunit